MKTKRLFAIVATLLLVALVTVSCVLSFSHKGSDVYAGTQKTVAIEDEENDDEGEVQPRLFTSLSISINGGDGKVWATVKNDFTLFPSTVIVVLILYSSETYVESYTQMEMVSNNTSYDLDMGKTLRTEAPTGGVEKYWIARMRYKIDSESWASRTTGVCKIGADGEFLGFI